ncbi:MAG TPA: hypothetical protein VJN96_25365 [Vicinamibacterales bacterium]|nr:hypothetical protein [Vicinamibacterales bacterium]
MRFTLTLVALVALGTQAQPPVTPRMPADLSPDERTAITTSVNQLIAIVRRTPQMAPPSGFAVVPHAFVEIQNFDHSESRRVAYVTADVTANLAPLVQNGRGAAMPNERDTAAHVQIKVNDLQPLMGSELSLGDDEGTFIENPPEPVETVHGFPVFEEGNGQRWIMIRRNDVPFFAPVTAERFARATMAKTERELAEAQSRRAKMPAGVPASIAATVDEAIAGFKDKLAEEQRALAAMSASERAAPAHVADSAVVYFNPALMTPGLPRTAPQVLAVGIGASDAKSDLAAKLDSELDWAALGQFVHAR